MIAYGTTQNIDYYNHCIYGDWRQRIVATLVARVAETSR